MTQLHLGLDLSTKRTRKRDFLDEMRRVVPWSRLIALIEPHYPKGKTGRPPFPVPTMLQIHFLQQWFGLSDPAMEEALYDVPLYREFAGLHGAMTRLPDETTILRFRHLLEAHGIAAQILAVVNEILNEKGLMLKAGSAVDATLIAAPSSTKNGSGTRDREMQSTQKGRNWYFGMKAHIGVDAESGLVHTVIGTAANEHDINTALALLHGEETDVYADAGYQGIEKRKQPELGSMACCDAAQRAKKIELEGSSRCDIRQDRTTEGRHSCKGRTSVSNSQATVWLFENAIPGAGEEHRSDHHIICVGQFMDDAQGAMRSLKDTAG